MKKEIVTIEDALTITSNAEINDAIRAMHEYSITSAKLEDEPYDEELKQQLAEMAIVVKSKQESIHQLHEMLEKMEATRKAIREVLESIVSEIPMAERRNYKEGFRHGTTGRNCRRKRNHSEGFLQILQYA